MTGDFIQEEIDGINANIIDFTEKEILKKINEMDVSQTLLSGGNILHSRNDRKLPQINDEGFSGGLNERVSHIYDKQQKKSFASYSLLIKENGFIYDK